MNLYRPAQPSKPTHKRFSCSHCERAAGSTCQRCGAKTGKTRIKSGKLTIR